MRLSFFPTIAILLWCPCSLHAMGPNDYFGIQVIDDQTGRGVPLVELETVNHLRWTTDSAGWIAIHEPGWMDREVFLFVKSHGYEFPKDGFGYAGTRIKMNPGGEATIRIQRVNIAERLYRITGEGIYRDSVLLGKEAPVPEPLGSGRVAGQDSAFAEIYRDRIWWFWGDTARMRYPLGHFWMASAISDLPDAGGLDPGTGVHLDYFTGEDGFSRPVARMGVEKGMIWADGFLVLPDSSGRERLVCHYAHMESLSNMLEHGLAVWNDAEERFERLKRLDRNTRWRFPGQAHPIRYREHGTEYIYFGESFPNVRVRADWEHYIDPAAYEVYTCAENPLDPAEDISLIRDKEGKVRYAWRNGSKPMDSGLEQKLVAAGKLRIEETHFLPIDVDTGKPVRIHRGSVRWNPYRQRWILIAGEVGGTSHLGEIWYAEAEEPTGPWRRAKKIVTHDRYSFYNPVHHAFFDQKDGQVIYFEGTYTHTFSGNPVPTPRYDYNQIMYRLDLSDERLQPAME